MTTSGARSLDETHLALSSVPTWAADATPAAALSTGLPHCPIGASAVLVVVVGWVSVVDRHGHSPVRWLLGR
jgi:hypothetical protein